MSFRIWTGCDFICSAYDDGRDASFYMCHDRIGSLTMANFTNGTTLDAVLGCQVCRVAELDGGIALFHRHEFLRSSSSECFSGVYSFFLAKVLLGGAL